MAIAIVGILAALGYSSVRDEIHRYHLMQAARRLHADAEYLRVEAIATDREMRLLLVAADDALDPAEPQVGEWLLQAGNRSSSSTVWDTLPIDEDGVPDESDGIRDLSKGGNEEAGGISLAPWPALSGPGATNANAIVFSPRGFLSNPATDFTGGYITLKLVDKRDLARGGDVNVRVRISRGGMARMETGASSTLPENPVGTAEASSP